LRTTSPAALEQWYFHNPYFPPEALFAARNRDDGQIAAVGSLIINTDYANPRQVDPAMPCFRLGAFGAEGMQTKRINGMFSFVTRSADVTRLGLDLLGYVAFRVQQASADALAAQAPSDAPALYRFYQSHFRRQGSFPVLEKSL
jgi:hypothetical protein